MGFDVSPAEPRIGPVYPRFMDMDLTESEESTGTRPAAPMDSPAHDLWLEQSRPPEQAHGSHPKASGSHQQGAIEISARLNEQQVSVGRVTALDPSGVCHRSTLDSSSMASRVAQ